MTDAHTRFILPSDTHDFVGRIYDLSIIGMHSELDENIAWKLGGDYVLGIDSCLSALVSRVESLNMVGNMLWFDRFPSVFKNFPVSRYQWLTITSDVFLMRFISVLDCVLILINEVMQYKLQKRDCTVVNLKRAGVSKPFLDIIFSMMADQRALRYERNERFHHGIERGFSSEDQIFRIGSLFEHENSVYDGSNDQAVPLAEYFREGITQLQSDFNKTMQSLVSRIENIYDLLSEGFERSFLYFRSDSDLHTDKAYDKN